MLSIFLIFIFMMVQPGMICAGHQQTVNISDDDWIEVAIFVHGISPSKEDSDSDESYQKLVKNLEKYYGLLGSLPFDKSRMIYIKYGSLKNREAGQDNISDYLTAMQRKVGEEDNKIWKQTEDDPPSMLRSVAWRGVREVLLYGVSDAFYYNSPEGGNDIRRTILLQINKNLMDNKILDENGMLPEGKKISFTIFAHSLGGIVMYDILRSIFIDVDNLKVSYPQDDVNSIVEGLHLLRESGRLRIRKFYTFGTQISMMFFKYPDSIKTLRNNQLQDISAIFPPSDQIDDPRWLNFWDKDDILGFPFEFLFQKRDQTGNKILKDVAVDAGDYLPHVQYWDNKTMAVEIIKDFLGLDEKAVEFLLR